MADNEKKQASIKKRQDEEKVRFIEELKRVPNKSIAAKRAGISRATLYRWLSEDPQFGAEMGQAMLEGDEFINDMAEAQLFSKIESGNWPPTRYRLDRRHPKYMSRRRRERREKEQSIKTLIMDI